MKIGLLFWLLMLIWLIFGFVIYWPSGSFGFYSVAPLGGTLLLWVLLALLGWKVFGPILQD